MTINYKTGMTYKLLVSLFVYNRSQQKSKCKTSQTAVDTYNPKKPKKKNPNKLSHQFLQKLKRQQIVKQIQ